MRPVGTGEPLEAEEGTCFLVDPSHTAQVVPHVLRVRLNDTTWEKRSWTWSPANPDPSAARVAISNSNTVGGGGGGGDSPGDWGNGGNVKPAT